MEKVSDICISTSAQDLYIGSLPNLSAGLLDNVGVDIVVVALGEHERKKMNYSGVQGRSVVHLDPTPCACDVRPRSSEWCLCISRRWTRHNCSCMRLEPV